MHAPASALRTRCRYQDPSSTQTLREGLAEYHAANPDLFDPEEIEAKLGDLGPFFAAHDACHVLFGLDTSLGDETLADTWTLVGTDAKLSELLSYFRSDAQKQFFKEFIAEIGYWKLFVASLRSVPRVLKAMWMGRKMTRKWVLHEWESKLDVPLHQLRSDYGIRLV
ncbi:MAG: hypothetical protein AAF799_21540 [Myxococcota bacterium]